MQGRKYQYYPIIENPIFKFDGIIDSKNTDGNFKDLDLSKILAYLHPKGTVPERILNLENSRTGMAVRNGELIVFELSDYEEPSKVLATIPQSKKAFGAEILSKVTQYYEDIFAEDEDEEQRKKEKELIRLGSITSKNWNIAENLDRKTVARINTLNSILEDLKQSKDFYLIAPILNAVICTEANTEQLSEIVINYDDDLILTQFDSLKIKLSHLTKAIYILFLKHSEGLDKVDMINCKGELTEIYKNISYQNSHDKIINSIEALYKNDLRGFAIHFSRIKSAFIYNFSDTLAQYYYIKSTANGKKKIELPTDLIKFR